jgi:Ca-activated chloride channel family protein
MGINTSTAWLKTLRGNNPPHIMLDLIRAGVRISDSDFDGRPCPGTFGGSLEDRAAKPAIGGRLVAGCAPNMVGMGLRNAALASLLCVTFAFTSWAQSPTPGPTRDPNNTQKIQRGKPLKSEVDITLVNVTVTDPYGRLVTGLEQDSFRVFEDNVEQEIVRFSSEDVPISIGVIFDMSGSMTDKIDKSRLAAVQFFRTANPQDEFFLVDFNDRAQLASPFTASIDELQNRLMFTSAQGATALYDGIYLGLSQMKGAHNTKKALLIISDGGDNHSRYTQGDVRSFVKEADVQIYAIGLYTPGGGPTREEQEGPALLSDLTTMTGGRTFAVRQVGELPDIASKISMELRNQYVIGYRPTDRAHDGKWRKIKIKLRPPKGLPPLTVFNKSGYFGPGH